jgi:hypothetical protein
VHTTSDEHPVIVGLHERRMEYSTKWTFTEHWEQSIDAIMDIQCHNVAAR